MGSALVLLSVPMVLEMAMESLFAVVDVFFVSRVSADAVATVGVTESMLTIVYTVAMGLGIGATAVVARRIGEKDDEGAAQAAAQAIALGLILSAVIGVFGWFNAERLLRLMGATPSMIDSSLGYTQVMFAGNATVTLLFLNNAIFRGAGDPAIAMRVLWIGNAINMVMDPVLIFGLGPFPELGVTGAAVATNIGRGIAVLIQFWTLCVGQEPHPHHAPPPRAGAGGDVERVPPERVGLPADPDRHLQLHRPGARDRDLRQRCAGRLHDRHPDRDLRDDAGVGARQRGGDHGRPGARRRQARARRSRQCGPPPSTTPSSWAWSARSSSLFASPIVAIFTTDPAVVPDAVDCLRIVSAGFVFFAYGLVFTQAFNGAGDTWTPTWINLGCFWAWQIPLAWLLAIKLGMGPNGVYIAMTVAFSTLAMSAASSSAGAGGRPRRCNLN